MIENERIRIYPALQEQMESVIAAEKDEELKKAFWMSFRDMVTLQRQ